jgi:hypothetical protein
LHHTLCIGGAPAPSCHTCNWLCAPCFHAFFLTFLRAVKALRRTAEFIELFAAEVAFREYPEIFICKPVDFSLFCVDNSGNLLPAGRGPQNLLYDIL